MMSSTGTEIPTLPSTNSDVAKCHGGLTREPRSTNSSLSSARFREWVSLR